MLEPLLPKDLTEKDAAFKTVEELHEVIDKALDKGEIKNIALTGPFGSGKSSVLQTLRKRYKEFEYLPISLATLRSEEEESDGEEEVQEGIQENSGQPKGNESKSSNGYSCHKSEKQVEKLNRRIEYSILQQLIYRERTSTVQNSRFRRIVHIEENRLRTYAWFAIGLILAIIVVFFPDFGDVRSLLISYGLGRFLPFLKLSGFAFILYIIYLSVKSFVKSYCNSKLNKLNLKDMYIEIEEENSIFNKHLDEILYFFQVTKYNVVIIEDLDRFGTSDIFLKLRELNQLINESKIVGRNVVFVYAVKDDMFVNEERTKFFDYITTVIPVINPSNSKSKLKEALEKVGVENGVIKDGDLADMAFFIQDMRILTNIVNEFSQYKEKLTEKGQKLNLTKLLAMIVYKNYHPKDFAMLHRREGKVYSCIKAKPLFAKFALNEIELKEKELEKEYQEYLRVRHLNEEDLRFLFLCRIKNSSIYKLIDLFVDGSYYTIEQISKDEELFNKLISEKKISYQYRDYWGSISKHSEEINWNNIDNASNYTPRLKVLRKSEEEFEKKRARLHRAKLNVQRYKLNTLIGHYKQGNSETYKKIELSEMMDVFIRRGFIDEEYYDYISFFYEGMVSLSDRELLLSIKRDIKKEYSYHIDKVENFVKELLPYMFETKAILNNDLLDYVALFQGEYFNQMMYILEIDNAPLDFLAQYYLYGKEQKLVYEHYIKWNEKQAWINIELWKDDTEKNILIEGWLKYSKSLCEEARTWLNNHYEFLTDRFENIGKERCLDLVKNSEFKALNDKKLELLKHSIDNLAYEINSYNLCLIVNYLCNDLQVKEGNLNLSRIRDTKYSTFIEHIENNIDKAIMYFSKDCKDETKDSILFILNSEKIKINDKTSYLIEQEEQLDDDCNIDADELKTLAYSLFLINPTWTNVVSYYNNENKDEDILIKYIEHFSDKLRSQKIEEDNNIYSSLGTYLLGTTKLTIGTYSSIIRSFRTEFKGYNGLRKLDRDRLLLLLSHNMLPFNEENTNVLKETGMYADYLIKYHKQLLENLSVSYISNSDVVYKLLSSNVFTYEEKKRIVTITPKDLLVRSDRVANIVLNVILNTDLKDTDEETIIKIVGSASDESSQVYIILLLINEYNYDDSKIIELLRLLGDKYAGIADKSKRPALEKTRWNIKLVEALRYRGFVFSVKWYKNSSKENSD